MSPTAKLFRNKLLAVYSVIVFFEAVNTKAVSKILIDTEKPLFKTEAKKIKSQTLFVKIPQEHKNLPTKEILPQSIFPKDLDLGSGCTNQIAKMLIPVKAPNEFSQPASWDGTSFIKIPITRQPFEKYTIVVALAPRYFKIGADDFPVVVYIVFPDDDNDDTNKNFKIPEIYFVTKNKPRKNVLDDPILIIDNNRTVSGFKSSEIMRIVKFKRKLTDFFST